MRILIVEPESSGHHSYYLRLILEAFAGHERWLLTLPVPAELSDLADSGIDPDIKRVEIENHRPGPTVDAAIDLAGRESFDLVFFPFLDLMLPVLAGGRSEKLGRVAGIWMGPDALDQRYRFAPPLAKRPRVRGRVHRWLRRTDTAKVLRDLFFLVPHDVDQLTRVAPGIRGHLLHDPPESVSTLSQAEAREKLGLPPDGCILLHPGSAGRRKGLEALLGAYQLAQADGAKAPFLFRVGPNEIKGAEREQLDGMISAGRALATEKYVPTPVLADAFAACDWVAMPYRKFRHSSGMLGIAEAAGRPVLAPDYGHIAECVRAGQPGQLFKHGSIKSLARALPQLKPLGSNPPETHPHLIQAKQQTFIQTLADWLNQTATEISR